MDQNASFKVLLGNSIMTSPQQFKGILSVLIISALDGFPLF